MSEFQRQIQIRWADADPNFHVRHSVYYDWGAYCRIEFFNQYGLTDKVMMAHKIGPILFREEAVFRREIGMHDIVTINLHLKQARKDFSRWSIQHQLIKEDGQLAATITVDGAWIDMVKRKLATPPPAITNVLEQMPRPDGFEWMV